MSDTNKTPKRLMFAVACTLVLLMAHRFLPQRTLTLLPPHNQDMRTLLYHDSSEGGGAVAEWVNQDALHFRCRRFDPKLPSTYCGFSAILADDPVQVTHGIDLTPFDRLRVDIDADTSQYRLSIILRNYNPEYSSPSDENSAQHNALTIRTEDLTEPLTISFNEFNVSEWWLINRDISRQYTRPDFSNVTVLGVDLRDNLGPGEHHVTIHSVQAIGKWVSAERWYLGIIGAWLLGIFVYSINRSFHWLRHARGTEKKLKTLTTRHQQLRGEARTLKTIAQHDNLSGLLNRYGLTQAFAQLDTEQSWPIAIILLDIDHFKRINDLYGHAQGDVVIEKISHILSQTTRDRDLLARWGGEEFLLLCPYTSVAQAQRLAEKLRLAIAEAEFSRAHSLAVTTSLGVAELHPQESLHSAIDRADIGLYRAKTKGRNRTELG